MRNGLNVALALGFSVTLLQWATAAEDKPATPAAPKPADERTGRCAEALPGGAEAEHELCHRHEYWQQHQARRVDLDVDAMAGAIKDVLAGRTTKLTDQQAQEAMRSYQMEARAKHEQRRNAKWRRRTRRRARPSWPRTRRSRA